MNRIFAASLITFLCLATLGCSKPNGGDLMDATQNAANGAQDAPNDTQSTKAIEGTWSVYCAASKCRICPGRLANTYTFENGKFTATTAEGEHSTGQYLIRSGKPPGEIEFEETTGQMPASHGVFEIRGDRMTLCLMEEGSEVREFRTDPNQPLRELMILRRCQWKPASGLTPVASDEEEAIGLLTDASYHVICDDTGRARAALGSRALTEEMFVHVAKLKHMEMLMVSGGKNVETLHSLESLHTLVMLDAQGMTLEDFESLRAFPKLCFLGVERASTQSLASIAKLENIEVLLTDDTFFKDADIKHLTPLPSLEVLSMENALLTDAGLMELAKIKSLSHLYLKAWSYRGSETMTREGVEGFRAARPDCEIHVRRITDKTSTE